MPYKKKQIFTIFTFYIFLYFLSGCFWGFPGDDTNAICKNLIKLVNANRMKVKNIEFDGNGTMAPMVGLPMKVKYISKFYIKDNKKFRIYEQIKEPLTNGKTYYITIINNGEMIQAEGLEMKQPMAFNVKDFEDALGIDTISNMATGIPENINFKLLTITQIEKQPCAVLEGVDKMPIKLWIDLEKKVVVKFQSINPSTKTTKTILLQNYAQVDNEYWFPTKVDVYVNDNIVNSGKIYNIKINKEMPDELFVIKQAPKNEIRTCSGELIAGPDNIDETKKNVEETLKKLKEDTNNYYEDQKHPFTPPQRSKNYDIEGIFRTQKGAFYSSTYYLILKYSLTFISIATIFLWIKKQKVKK